VLINEGHLGIYARWIRMLNGKSLYNVEDFLSKVTEETDKDETNQEWKGDDTNDDAATKSKQENQA
jgi:hypothetical protein